MRHHREVRGRNPFVDLFLAQLAKAETPGQVKELRALYADRLMDLRQGEPWLYGDVADKIAARLRELGAP